MLAFVFALCGFSSAIANRTLDPLTAAIAGDLNVTISAVALLSTALALAYAFGQPVIGPLGDHYGKQRVLKIALWVTAASVLASAFAPDFTALMVLRPITGFASGGIIPIGMAILGGLHEGPGRQVALARFIMSAIIGQMAGAMFAGVLEAWIGWRGVLIAASVFIFVAAAITTRLLKSGESAHGKPFSFAGAAANYGLIFRKPRAWMCFSSPLIIGGVTFGLLPFIAPILQSQNNGAGREAGFIIAGFGGGSLLLSLSLPWVLKLMPRPRLMMLGSSIAALSLAAYAAGLHWGVQVALFTVFGFGFFMQHNSIQAEVSDLAPEARATAYAMHSSFLFLGQAVGPVIYGFEIAHAGATGALLANACVIAIAGMFIGSYFARNPVRGET